MLKLFIAVVIQAYHDIKSQEEKLFNDQMLKKFILCWQTFDTEVSSYKTNC
jgi:hypothetical protein